MVMCQFRPSGYYRKIQELYKNEELDFLIALDGEDENNGSEEE